MPGILLAIVLLAVACGITTYLYRISQQQPRELGYWLNKAAGRDWTAEAASGKPEAQLCVGLNLIRTNLVVMIDRVPGLASVPLLGRRFFEQTHYSLAPNLAHDHLIAAYGWIKKAADQNLAAAVSAQGLFAGRIAELSGSATNVQPQAFTNATSQSNR